MVRHSKKWAEVILKAWKDEKFKERLIEAPDIILKEHGIDVPVGVQYMIHENTSTLMHMALPAKPPGHLTDEQLKDIAEGLF
jgi:hypothetical protein